MVKISPRSQSQPTSPSSASDESNQVERSRPFSDDEVRAKAHQLWLKRGGGQGEEKKDWEKAIKALKWERSLLGKTFYVLGTPGRAVKFVQFAFKADTPKDALDVVKTVISALGLIATAGAVIGLVINYQQGQERLVTDRFAKAVEQLGSKESNVRIGAIYSLERIAKDSPKDHWTVMEILTAYVRDRSPLPKDWATTATSKRKKLPTVTIDVQSALTVIGRRNSENNRKRVSLNLASTNLKNANLKDANLVRVNLSYANLEDAYFGDADLNGAYLHKANLEGAYL